MMVPVTVARGNKHLLLLGDVRSDLVSPIIIGVDLIFRTVFYLDTSCHYILPVDAFLTLSHLQLSIVH